MAGDMMFVIEGSAAEEADGALNDLWRLDEATAGSVEVPLAGRVDSGCDVTFY